jgi:cob(I)alamin adenosyltransferase
MVMLHIYYGNGKGKTTAAIGLAVRACGAGMKTAIFQFLKNGSSSEISVLKSIENIDVVCCKKFTKFTFLMNDKELSDVTEEHNEMLRRAEKMLANDEVQLIVLDEFLDAYNKKLIDTELADSFIDNMISKCEVVMTGRAPTDKLIEAADYLTEMKAVKHPYNNGISARKGIEY